MRTAHGDHVEELELRITDLTDRCRGLIETHRAEIEEEREKRKKDLADAAEEHKEAIQVTTALKLSPLPGFHIFRYNECLDKINEMFI